MTVIVIMCDYDCYCELLNVWEMEEKGNLTAESVCVGARSRSCGPQRSLSSSTRLPCCSAQP